jgi:hypothetical protein
MKFNFKVASPYTLPTFAGASGVACLGHESWVDDKEVWDMRYEM